MVIDMKIRKAMILEFFTKLYDVLFPVHQWYILYKKNGEEHWRRLKQPKNVSRADSFIVYENGRYYIFF